VSFWVSSAPRQPQTAANGRKWRQRAARSQLIGPNRVSREIAEFLEVRESAFRDSLPRPPLACRPSVRYILNRMVQYLSAPLDASFAALSDATRRGVLEQLGRADASITDLAEKFHMTLTGMKKHVGVLEQARLVTTKKVGRVRTCKLGLWRLEEETAWIERYRQLWAARFDDLDKVVEELKRKEKVDGRKKRK
jgi:DNA-binding transcriptional ArsR family regulator